MTPRLLNLITLGRIRDMASALMEADFELEPTMTPLDRDFVVRGGDDAVMIAQDGSGGPYALVDVGSEDVVLYMTSEGQAGVIASSLEEMLELFIECPRWQDVLKYSDHGRLDEMKRAAELSGCQDDLFIEKLHANISRFTNVFTVQNSGGDVFDSLFGSFRVEDNAFWR